MLLMVLAVVPAAAHATFPGANGELLIGFDPPRAVDPETGAVRTIFEVQDAGLAAAFLPSASADGLSMVFQGVRYDDPVDPYIAPLDGGAPELVMQHAGSYLDSPVFAGPEGDKLVAVKGGSHSGSLVTVAVPDGTTQRLTKNRRNRFDAAPAAAPDGSRIAFHREGFNAFDAEIYTVAADGSDLQRLTDLPHTSSFDPSYSPDGSKIVFVRWARRYRHHNGQVLPATLHVMRANGAGRATQITPLRLNCYSPVFSPDGRHIAALCKGKRIAIMNTDGSDVHFIGVKADDGGLDWAPAPAGP